LKDSRAHQLQRDEAADRQMERGADRQNSGGERDVKDALAAIGFAPGECIGIVVYLTASQASAASIELEIQL